MFAHAVTLSICYWAASSQQYEIRKLVSDGADCRSRVGKEEVVGLVVLFVRTVCFVVQCGGGESRLRRFYPNALDVESTSRSRYNCASMLAENGERVDDFNSRLLFSFTQSIWWRSTVASGRIVFACLGALEF